MALVTAFHERPAIIGIAAKVAVHVKLVASITVTAGDTPAQPPDQPANVDAIVGLAVSVTEVFWVKLAAQVAPQLSPAGAEVTAPAPVPAFDITSDTSPADANVRPDRAFTAEISDELMAPVAFRSNIKDVALAV